MRGSQHSKFDRTAVMAALLAAIHGFPRPNKVVDARDKSAHGAIRFPATLAIGIMAALQLVLGASAPRAHEGEDHGTLRQRPMVIDAAPRTEAVSEHFELVAVARSAALTIYLDRRRSNEPVVNAAVTVETPSGSVAASRQHDGTYRLAAPWSATPARHDLIFTVESGGTREILPATLEIPVSGATTTTSLPQTEAGSRSGWLKEAVQRIDPHVIFAWIIGLLTGGLLMGLLARRRIVSARALLVVAALVATVAHAHEGHDHGVGIDSPKADDRDLARRLPDGTLFVPKSTQRLLAIRTDIASSAVHRRGIELPGRIIPDPNASGYVQASAGGRLSAPAGGFLRLGARVSKGDVLAYVTPPLQAIDVSDMRQRQGELDQQISIVERRIARYETLAQKGAVSQVQLDETRLELQGLKDRRGALDRVRVDPEALVSPVSGIIAEINAVAGQMAQTSAILFQIIEPTRLWVEALSFDTLSGAHTAAAKTSGGHTFPLSYQGTGFADRNQAVPVHFKIEGDTGGLRAGQFVTVLAATEDKRQGIALSRASVVRTQGGEDLAFEHTSAERFEPRSVRVEPLDGERVLVTSGLSAGARVVTQGAELLDQLR
jgi:cobalt-zinc-cadmium efflux system membrane fusion protein